MGVVLMNHFIRTEKADNSLRKLAKGFTYQTYRIHAVKIINKQIFKTEFGNNGNAVRNAHLKWEDTVKAYINRRARNLGMWVGGIVGQLVEEPNEDKAIEVMIWETQNTQFVFSIWAHLKGPVPETERIERSMPLFGFWPWEISSAGNSSIPEIVDASMLTLKEQGVIKGLAHA